jgi:type VI secretion system secreted protein Hcp
MRACAMKGLTALAVVALGWVSVPSARAEGRDGRSGHQEAIKACVEKRGGETRLVPPGRPCRDNEIAVFWNVEGPRGEQGPAGARGATGAPGRDGVDGRDGKDGRDAQAPPAIGPIGTLNGDDIHKPEESSPILSVSGGLSVTGDSTGGGGGSGKVNFQDLHITKSVDQFSPKLYMFGATGRQIPTVDINVFRQGTQDVELSYRLEDAFVTSIQQSGGGSSVPVESVSFNFARIRLTFTPLGSPAVTFCYDVKLNKVC